METVYANGNSDPEVVIDPQHNIVLNVSDPPSIPKCSVAEYLAKCMSSYPPDTEALIEYFSHNHLNYGQFYQLSKRFAKSLVEQCHLNKSDLVLMFGENSIEYAVSMLATIFTGVTFSPVTPANGQFELTQQIIDSKGTILIIDWDKLEVLKNALENQQFAKSIEAHLKLIIVLNGPANEKETSCFLASSIICNTYKQLMKMSEADRIEEMNIPCLPVEPDDHFVVIYTSGTTGLPKGAIHSNRSVLGLLANDRAAMFIGTKLTIWYPFGHASGTFFLMGNIVRGNTSVLFRETKLEPLLECVHNHKLYLLSISPEHVPQMAKVDYSKKYDLSSLKLISCVGSKSSIDHIKSIQQNYKVVFADCYGSTEYLGAISNDTFIGKPPPDGSVGRPKKGVQMRIVDLISGENLPPFKQGEICVKGPGLFVGYLRNQTATASTIDQDGWYHTGDIGYYDQSGALFVMDRIKEMIKFREWTIVPTEIEHFLSGHQSVENCCVVGIKHNTDGYLLRAYVKLREGQQQLSEQQLIQMVHDNMGFQKRLRAGVSFIEKMPTTSLGKVDRKYFRNLVKDELITEPVD